VTRARILTFAIARWRLTNIDALWAKLLQMMPNAQRGRLLHTLEVTGHTLGGGWFFRRSPTRVALSRGHF
jgi:hypothetical protein